MISENVAFVLKPLLLKIVWDDEKPLWVKRLRISDTEKEEIFKIWEILSVS